MDFKETKKALEIFARAVVLQSKKNLDREDAVASGKLKESISSNLKVYPNSFALEFYMEDYGPFIDEGVKGSKSTYYESRNSPFKYTGAKKTINTKSLDQWLVRKKLAPRDKEGKFITRKSLKFIIGKSIYEKGIRARRFFTPTFKEEFEKLNQDVVEAFGLDVNDFLLKTQVV